uniref:Uncharacterized protein n=1 Tax=Lactuca sativa TaxID=4236 RepID=A0A9R1VZ48_LACSA|nr:hypothetical protein LSAT_V11C300107080 [Lactuca sativa]
MKHFETNIMNDVGDVANFMMEACHHELTGDEIYQELQPMSLEPCEIPGALIYLARNQADARTLFSCPVTHIHIEGATKTMTSVGK